MVRIHLSEGVYVVVLLQICEVVLSIAVIKEVRLKTNQNLQK